jgi:hypothetical protein
MNELPPTGPGAQTSVRVSRRQPCQPTGGTGPQNGGSERVNACNWRLIDRTHLTLRQSDLSGHGPVLGSVSGAAVELRSTASKRTASEHSASVCWVVPELQRRDPGCSNARQAAACRAISPMADFSSGAEAGAPRATRSLSGRCRSHGIDEWTRCARSASGLAGEDWRHSYERDQLGGIVRHA